MTEKRNMDVSEIFKTFANYGYRKTSMENVAQAIGISRQALYKKFKSKEALFEWMVSEIIRQSMLGVEKVMDDQTRPLIDRLVAAFDCWMGQYIEAMRFSPHGAELMEQAVAITKKESAQASPMVACITHALLNEGITDSVIQAENSAYTLYMASKGLGQMAEGRKDFNNQMRRIVGVVVPR